MMMLRFLVVADEILDTRERFGNLINRSRVGTTDMPLAAVAERAAWNERHMLSLKKFLRELLTRVACTRDIGENIESAFWLEAVQSHLHKALVDEPTTAIVFRDHFFHILFTVTQRLNSCELCCDGSAEHRILMDFRHGGDDFRCTECIADAPACHGICFGKTVEQ